MADYNTFQQNWRDRLAYLDGRGVDVTKLKPIIDSDFARLQRGEQTLTDTEAIAGSLTAATGKQVIQEPIRKSSNLFDVVGNIPSDIGTILRGVTKLPGAVISEAKAIPGIPEAVSQGDWSDIPSAARSLAQVPVARWVPGVNTAAALTTPQGRQELLQHPVSTALDLLPAAGLAARGGAAVARSAGLVDPALVASKTATLKTAATTGREALVPAAERLTAPERTYASAAAGHPISALLETTGTKPLITKLTNPLTDHIRASIKLSKGYNVAQREAQIEINNFNRQLSPYWEKMDNAEKSLLYNEWVNPRDYPNPSPSHQAILDMGRSIQGQFAEEGIQAGSLFPVTVEGRTFIFPKAGPKNLDLLRSVTRTTKAQDTLAEAIKRGASPDEITLLTKASRDAQYTMKQNFLSTSPASFHPILEADIKSQAIEMVKGKYNSGDIGKPQLDLALKSLDQGDYRRVFDPESPITNGAFKPKAYDRLVSDVEKGWYDLASSGLDPIFLHNVPSFQPFKASRAKIIALNELTPGQFLPKDLTDMSPRYTNVGVGLSAGAAEFINMRGTESFILNHMLPRGLTYEEVLKIEQPQIDRLASKGIPPDQARAQVLSRYKLIKDPADFGISSNTITARMGGQELYLPNSIYKAAQSVTKSRTPETGFGKISQRGTSIFKASLFTLSPRHFADEVFGNALLMSAKGGLDEWRNASKAWNTTTGGLGFGKAIQAAVNGELTDTLPVELSRGIDIMSADQIWQTAFGKKMGKFTHQLGAVQRVTELFNNVERTMSYLGEEARQLRKGTSPELARDIGLQHANRAFIDWDSFTPIERTVVKQIFPFYSFTRYLMQYLYEYPADHPIRASILSRITNSESKDQESGLPAKFNQLFFLGHPDVTGNIKASDVRALNPFRDGANMFTWAGFFSSLGPFVQIPMQVAGINTLGGTPELYPELSIDPTTGNIVAKRTNIASRSGAVEAIAAFIPPIAGGIDHFVGLTDRVRRLKATDPTAYRRQLFSSLGIPFVPYNVNVPQEVTKQQRNLVRVAQQRVSEATHQGGSTTELRRYNVVPWQGQLIQGSTLADIIDQLHAASAESGVPTRMLMAELAKMVK